MELLIPVLVSSAAFGLLILGLVFRHIIDSDELFYFSMIFSTIFFFLGGVCFIDVTYMHPVTGALITVQTYNFLVWLMVPFGFIPILLMYQSSFDTKEEE